MPDRSFEFEAITEELSGVGRNPRFDCSFFMESKREKTCGTCQKMVSFRYGGMRNCHPRKRRLRQATTRLLPESRQFMT